MFKGTKLVQFTLVALVVMAIYGCSGGGSPVDPNGSERDSPREVLVAFADACEAGDVEAACGLLLNPSRYRTTIEKLRPILPFYGNSIRGAIEEQRTRDCYRYNFRLRHPDDPQGREIETRIFVVRVRGMNGLLGRWGIDFTFPGDGHREAERLRNTIDRTSIDMNVDDSILEREAQWGTCYTHASILTRAIIAYYYLMYPEDADFTGPQGWINPSNLFLNVTASHPGPIDTILGFDFDTYENMPPDVWMMGNAACELIQAGSTDEDVFVGEYNADWSLNFTREIVISWDGGISITTSNGFGDDDDTFLKGFGHFLTPITQNIYQTEFSEFDDIELFGGTEGAAVKAIDWALGQGILGPYDVLGILSMRESRNRKTLPEAINLLTAAMTNPDLPTACSQYANAFYTFGYTLHLLEDLSCPAHVRNDMHGVPIVSSIPGLGALQPDPIEDWGETLTPTFVNETIDLFMDLIAENDRITRDETGFPGNYILQNLYDNAEHADYPGVEALFEYSAMIANRMCFSEDTIYRSTNYDAANTDNYPFLTELNLDFFGRTVLYGKPGSEISDEQYLVAVGSGSFDAWRSWFWMTHWFTDPDLNDVIDALHDDWDILTVADDADDDYFGNSTLGVREQQWTMMFPHAVRVGAAYLHEYYLMTH